MEASAYLGLFYLSSGSLLFFLIFFGLRELGAKNQNSSTSSEDPSTKWTSTESLKIVDIHEETHDIKTFRLQRHNNLLFPEFEEGQFMSFQIGAAEDKVLRSYSISSSSTNRHTINVSIKKLANGLGSGWFHSRKIGDEVVAYPPNGLFTTSQEKYENNPLVMIAGGIGITPFLSMIQTATDCATPAPIHLFYAMKSTDDLAFHSELELLSQRNPNFQYYPFLSKATENWTANVGRINFDVIKEKVSDFSAAKYFFCGPPALTDSVTEKLLENGVNESHIHGEKFASPASLDPSKIPERNAKVEFSGNNYNYSGKQSLLEFLEDQGENISFACRSGVCGACKCKLESGKVDAFTDSGLNADEIKSGYILSCVARPETNIKLSL